MLDRVAVEEDLAGVQRQVARECLDQRGLAGAVVADDGDHLAGLDVENRTRVEGTNVAGFRVRHSCGSAPFGIGRAHPFVGLLARRRGACRPGAVGRPDAPTAIFSSNPRCSLQIVRSLHTAGRTDVALISFCDFPMADTLTPPVTVIDQDPVGPGAFAANRLFERVDHPGKRIRRQTVLDVRLVTRGSCHLVPPGSVTAGTDGSRLCTIAPPEPAS